MIFLPGHGLGKSGEFLPGAYLVEAVEHFYTRIERKAGRPQETRLAKAVRR